MWRRRTSLVTLWWCLLLLVFAGAGPASPAVGAQSFERITNYVVDLDLQPSGLLEVRETIDYQFSAGPRRGIQRFIPIQVRYDDRYDRRYHIDDVSVQVEPLDGMVTSGNASGVDDVVVTESNDNVVIRVGDPNTFVSGTWRYTISYQVRDAVETVDVPQVGTIEELAWNAIGTEWTVPIESATVNLASPVPPTNTRCFVGSFRSTTECAVERNGDQLTVETTDLAPGEAVTLYLDLPPGSVQDATADLVERWTVARAFRATPFTLGGSALASLAVGGLVASLLSRQGRDRRLVLNAYLPAEAEPQREGLTGFFDKPDGPVQFRPPDGMTPGLCGVLTDEQADPLDVSASIVDLAVRGYLRIEEVSDGQLAEGSRRSDFRIRFVKPPDDGLVGYERMLIDKLEAHAPASDPSSVTTSTLRTRFSGEMSAVRDAMYVETMKRRWFRRRPDRTRAAWVGIGLTLLVGGGILAALLIAFTSFGLFALPLVLPGLLTIAAAKSMPSRTSEGRRQLELCVGYERFLEVADAEQLQFQERQHQYVAGLPYAMVFGITEHWARVLSVLQEQGMDLTPNWYVPIYAGGVFHYAHFGRSMSDFGSTAAAALSAPAPTSTGGGMGGGGFSGGFSGGGGGGGGGGSW